MEFAVMIHLSPRKVARAIGVSESSLKRWTDSGLIAVVRTPGGHRRIEQREAIRFIRDEGLPLIDPASLGLADITRLPHDQPTTSTAHDDALRAAILNGDADTTRALALAMYLAGRPVHELCDGPFTAAMHEVGDLWKHDPDGIHVEHRATDVCLQGLDRLRSVVPPAAADAPVAIGGAPAGDPYLIPSIMAALVLMADGWHAINLGPNLPLPALQRAVNRHLPTLIWMSVSVEQAAPPVGDLEGFAADCAQHHRALILGGSAWRPPRRRIPNLHTATSMSQLHTFATGLKHPTP